MLLTITTTHQPATDLGFLLFKNPARAQRFRLSFGEAHVVYPEATAERCTAALLLDVDPVGLVRGRRGPEGDGGLLMQYVNDRPYVASSLFSVALAEVFGAAMAGRSAERPELAESAIPLEARVAVVPCRGGEELLRRLFEPLGYAVTAVAHPLDPTMPEWGASRYFTVTLSAHKRLVELLTHLYVLIPVLDDEKHYWVGDDEVEKLIRRGEGWLSRHPERELITRRYLKHQHSLVRDAIARLVTEEEPDEEDAAALVRDAEENTLERPLSLNEQRLADAAAVVEVIEHLDPPRLAAFERVAFEFARPGTVVLTTPNAEYNVQWPSLPAGRFRHRDHRFEWTREQFERWATGIAERFGYAVRFGPVGPVDAEVGPPTQMGIFTRGDRHV